MQALILRVTVITVLMLLNACGGDSAGTEAPTAPVMPVLSLDYGIKQLKFGWNAVSGATYYKLLENPDGVSGYSQIGNNLTGTSYDHDIPLFRRVNASYILEACNSGGCADSDAAFPADTLLPAIGYVKSSNTENGDGFGWSITLSGNGDTMAVGAPYEDSATEGIDGGQADNTASEAGAVYVFTHGNGIWSQQAYVKSLNTEANANFGTSVSLSGDGDTLAVGANGEASSAGAVYVYTRSGGIWSPQADVKALNSAVNDSFGTSVSLSRDGNTLAVGANGVAGSAGAVYVFTRSGGVWTQQGYFQASNAEAADDFGTSVALSGDGHILAVGSDGEDSAAAGIGGDQGDNSAFSAGAVYVFTRSIVGVWSQQAYIKASNAGDHDFFGTSVAMSDDGAALAVGAVGEDSGAGAAYMFTRNLTGLWTQQAYVKATNPGGQADFGNSIALSGDGNTLAVGARYEGSSATGVGGDQGGDSAFDSGAAYVFKRRSEVWSQEAYVKASNTDPFDEFGGSVAMSGDANTLAVGAPAESSAATGIGADQGDNSAAKAGAAYLY